MANRQGTPIWYELITPDADRSERFYSAVLGWRIHRPAGGVERDYRIAQAGDDGIAGLMQCPSGMAMPTGWHVYFGVDDVDAAERRAAAAGARVEMPPTDIPGVGRFAFLTDPQGVRFYVMRGASDEDSRAFRGGERAPQGHAVWKELSSSDPDAAIAFYGTLLEIRQDGGMPMGELGEYRFIHAGADCIGAVMAVPPDGEAGWLVYFAVDDIDAAAARSREAGGRTLQGPDPIPGGAFALVGKDPQGASFGLVGPRSA